MSEPRPTDEGHEPCRACRLARWGAIVCVGLLVAVWVAGWLGVPL